MDFIRDQFLSDFNKYSRNLTIHQRPTSRYYNTHNNRELAMLETIKNSTTGGGFSREHKVLPRWKVQNS